MEIHPVMLMAAMMMKRPKWRLALLLPAPPSVAARSRSVGLLAHDSGVHDFNKGDSDEGPSEGAIEGERQGRRRERDKRQKPAF